MEGTILQFISNEAASLTVIVVCIVLSAFFSSAETAITSLGPLKVKHLLDSQGKKVQALKLWLDHPGRVIATILLFNNVVNILASSMTTKVTYKYMESGAVGIATGLTTFLVLVFGEVIPKSFAKTHAERLSIIAMKLVLVFYYLGYPIIRALSGFADKVVTSLSGGQIRDNPLITEEELEFMVSEGEKAGVIEDIKKDIIEGAFDFDETKVREIMTPRTALTAIEAQTPFKEILDLIIRTGHSRLPVYREHVDHIVGLVLAKDLLNYSFAVNDVTPLVAKDLMRECLFAPESKSIMAVFKDLKRTKSHMAIIIDEYGGTAGIVTMEDILEEIVGEIQDEFDAEEAKILKIDQGIYEVSGSLNIEEFFDYFHINQEHLPGGDKELDVDTLAGWFTQLIGQMPQQGQTVEFGPVRMEVVDVQNRRIELVKVELIEPVSDQIEASSEKAEND